MRRTSLHNNKFIRKVFLLGAVFALIFILYRSNELIEKTDIKILEMVLKPAVFAKTKINNAYGNTLSLLANKKELREQNIYLENQIRQTQAKLEQTEIFRKEYFLLMEKWGRNPPKGTIMARVITPFLELAYDSIILDLGKESGIKTGMKITAYDGSILIGTVRETGKNFSRGVLLSSLNEETNVIFEKAQISAIARGRGNGELEILLPRELNIETGERVYTLHANPLLIGFVEKIAKKETDPLQKISIKLPFNIHQLHLVFLMP